MVVTGAVDTNMGRPKKKASEPPKTIAVRGSAAWVDWVTALAEARRLRVTDLVDQALVEYAEKHAFPKKAPKR